ncbi:MAG TPA: PqqD family peptide modification chaperone [Pyrinomonadaceae bacterium]|nr:PqqD family peptide modification chaperone [Pyrinomonadaceae bacterium]
MKENAGSIPRARREGLVIQELPDEVLVYDRERDKAHCLNQTAALVWGYCDGKTTVPTMARHLERDLDANKVDEKIVWYALDQLSKDHLLEESFVPPTMLGGMTRRQMVQVLGVAAVIAIPLVTSIVAPTPAQAATCIPSGQACVQSSQCCSGLCSSSICA